MKSTAFKSVHVCSIDNKRKRSWCQRYHRDPCRSPCLLTYVRKASPPSALLAVFALTASIHCDAATTPLWSPFWTHVYYQVAPYGPVLSVVLGVLMLVRHPMHASICGAHDGGSHCPLLIPGFDKCSSLSLKCTTLKEPM